MNRSFTFLPWVYEILCLFGMNQSDFLVGYVDRSTVGQWKKVTTVTFFPGAAAAGSNSTNKGQIHKVPVVEIARVLVHGMDVTRSQLSANTGIPVCLVREIWEFKLFAEKEATPLHEEGNSLQFRAVEKATHFHYNDLLIHDKQIKLNAKKANQQMKTTWYDHVATSGTR